MLPKDPVLLLSFINTQLRDNFKSLEDFCKSFNVLENEIIQKLEKIDYFYNEELNQFR